ncbi:DUF2201 family putative metallopeptidase [Streptomyces avicenniae]|uniref:vWA domain-containing protein n=1 Tax=Streptomyces avicenniae TaxID=500153 RepID=UPI00069A26E8|nr:hypothetical protein [Streptomyces avicenniae]
MSGGKAAARRDPAGEAYLAGLALVSPVFADLGFRTCREADCDLAPRQGLVRADSRGLLHSHPRRRAHPAEWAWAVSHALLHLGFGHLPATVEHLEQPDRFLVAARCAVVNRFLVTFAGALVPPEVPTGYPGGDEEDIAARWRRDGVPAAFRACGTAGDSPDQVLVPWPDRWTDPPDWPRAFAAALSRTVAEAVDAAGGRRAPGDGARREPTPWQRALDWFVASYPLLGGIAAGMRLIDDRALAAAHGIAVAAVDTSAGEIYVNPVRMLADEEWRFVLAHEMLHAALRHGDRRGMRDPYLFNVACDFVVNDWLVQMQVGDMPPGTLHDPALRGLSAEEVYDRIVGDRRRLRRLGTLRGRDAQDILGAPLTPPRDAVDLDEFYRRGLTQGLDLHRRRGRGLLPAGLVEEIAALSHPPLPWDAQLARWFDEFVPRPEPVRSYARPSRRQAATPDIPRAGRYLPPEEVPRCTFGVVLDTSCSMGRVLLGKALGAIASFAQARDVPAARLVHCDAAPHDAGYVPVTDLAGRVRVHGRGGTALQPGIDLLVRADDFPRTAPVLVITDGECEALRVPRTHAYLLPKGARLPFGPRGPVFSVR